MKGQLRVLRELNVICHHPDLLAPAGVGLALARSSKENWLQ